jgi:predicted protein tyrosine phosphatase
MTHRPNLLVVCGRNKKRSRTAEHLFKNDHRFAIRSAGLSPKSDRKLTEQDLTWADLVLVMENDQRSKIKDRYRHVDLPPVEVLHIEDVYEFMEEELILILQDRINHSLKVTFLL